MRLRSFLFLATTALAGCGRGESAPTAVPPAGPLHGGILVTLPGDGGSVELLNADRERRRKGTQTTIVAYVLRPDGQAPLSPPPGSVVVTLDPGASATTVPLEPAPDRGDPAGSGRFRSAPGPYELNQRGGEVAVTVGGATLTAPFRGPR